MEADRDQLREYWVEVVRSASDRGKLEKVPTRLARTKRECAQRDVQNYWLNKRSYGINHPNFDRINWEKRV